MQTFPGLLSCSGLSRYDMVVKGMDSAALRSTMSSCASYLTSLPQFPHLLNGLNEELTYIKSPEQNSALHKIHTGPVLA